MRNSGDRSAYVVLAKAAGITFFARGQGSIGGHTVARCLLQCLPPDAPSCRCAGCHTRYRTLYREVLHPSHALTAPTCTIPPDVQGPPHTARRRTLGALHQYDTPSDNKHPLSTASLRVSMSLWCQSCVRFHPSCLSKCVAMVVLCVARCMIYAAVTFQACSNRERALSRTVDSCATRCQEPPTWSSSRRNRSPSIQDFVLTDLE